MTCKQLQKEWKRINYESKKWMATGTQIFKLKNESFVDAHKVLFSLLFILFYFN